MRTAPIGEENVTITIRNGNNSATVTHNGEAGDAPLAFRTGEPWMHPGRPVYRDADSQGSGAARYMPPGCARDLPCTGYAMWCGPAPLRPFPR